MAALALSAHAARRPCGDNDARGDCGWWYGANPELQRRQAEEAQRMSLRPPTRAEKCRDAATWDSTCGFVDPRGSFEFQALQRDKLKLEMVMHPESPKAVEGFQRYSKWAVQQAIAVWRMWQWNMVQQPELNPEVAQPVTSFGLKALASEKSHRQADVTEALASQGAFLVWFTRSDCRYCAFTDQVVKAVAGDLKLPLYNASLDQRCEPGFSGEFCVTAGKSTEPARRLQVKVVPDLFLHLPQDNTWIRLATGVVTQDVIRDRVVLFFGAARAATANAISNRSSDFSPSVDFRDDMARSVRFGIAQGVGADAPDEGTGGS